MTAGVRLRRNLPDFWANVDTTDPDGCWHWTGVTDQDGYGIFKHQRAHRIAFGPTDLNVCHRCYNPPCVRPDHLFEGTHADNIHDAMQKGRHDAARRAVATYCKRGHEFTPENTYVNPTTGNRTCRKCKSAAMRSWERAHRVERTLRQRKEANS